MGELGSILGLGRSPGEGNGNPLQYSCLENPMDGGTWWATIHGVAKIDTTERHLLYFTLLTHIYFTVEKSGAQKELGLKSGDLKVWFFQWSRMDVRVGL